MAGSSIKVSKSNAVATDLEAPAGVRATKATASKAWESLTKKAKKTLTVGTKAASGSKRKPQSDEEDVPAKKAKRTSILSKVSLSSLNRGRRTVPNLTNSESESDLPSRVSTRAPLTEKGKAKAPLEDQSSGGSSDEFQPSDESDESDEEASEHDDQDGDKDGGFGLDAAARLNRKQSRQAAKVKAIKTAIARGMFDARWPGDKENIPPPEMLKLLQPRRLSTGSMPSLELVTDNDEDDSAIIPPAHAVAGAPPPPPPSLSVATSSTAPATRNIDLVLPAPGRRFLSLRAQPQPVQEVFDPALDMLAVKIYGSDAFPDRRTRADMKVGASLAALRGLNATHHDIESRIWNDPVYARLFTSLLEPRIPLMRSSLRDISDVVFLDQYDLPNRPADRAREVFRLSAACSFLYPLGSNGKPDRARPFLHPAILSTFHKKFLSGSPNFLELHSRELDIARSDDDPTPNRVPAPMIAFVATSVYASMIEWKTGHHVPIEFSRDNFNHTYRQYLKRLEDLREKFGMLVHRQYLVEFYESAMAFGSDDDVSVGDDDWDVALVGSRFIQNDAQDAAV